MRQETGSKTLTINNIVSIQLKLGGHFFSDVTISDYTASSSSQRVEFVLSTPKTTLVPKSQFNAAHIGRYLELNGMACSAAEVAIALPLWDDIIIICAINRECYEVINARLGSRAIFKTPFSFTNRGGERREQGIYVSSMSGVVYVMIFDGGRLLFAESLAAKNQADYIYIMERLSKEFSTLKDTLYISGEHTKEIIKILKSYSKKVICE